MAAAPQAEDGPAIGSSSRCQPVPVVAANSGRCAIGVFRATSSRNQRADGTADICTTAHAWSQSLWLRPEVRPTFIYGMLLWIDSEIRWRRITADYSASYMALASPRITRASHDRIRFRTAFVGLSRGVPCSGHISTYDIRRGAQQRRLVCALARPRPAHDAGDES